MESHSDGQTQRWNRRNQAQEMNEVGLKEGGRRAGLMKGRLWCCNIHLPLVKRSETLVMRQMITVHKCQIYFSRIRVMHIKTGA